MRKWLPILASAVLLAGCSLLGGNGDTEGEDANQQSGVGGAIGSYTDAEAGVIQIVAYGSYASPESGDKVQSADTGSGFIIDPSGLAVTNMHVVEGAGSLDVYVAGQNKPLNAKILGVSECNDLAVIDIQGEGFPYFEWFTDEVTPAMEVWAVGFPLGDPEYTIVDGSIAKTEANGDTSWASLDYALQHTGQIQPGNSGGPLIDVDGRVVGVNYAGNDETNTEQFFAIPGAIAQQVVSILATGQDEESVGINGEVYYDYGLDLGGLWVYGVRSGSAASNAGVQPGDIVTQLEGTDLVFGAGESDSGITKAGYCDILRTRGAENAIAIEVYRTNEDGSGSYLTGELNNPNKPLAPKSSLVSSGDENSGGYSDGDEFSSGGDMNFVTLQDESGILTIEVPEVWSNVTTDLTDEGSFIIASVSPDNFARTADGSGVYFESFDGAVYGEDLQDAFDYLITDYFREDIERCDEVEDSTSEVFEDSAYIAANYFSCNGSEQAMYFGVTSAHIADAWVAYLIVYDTATETDWANRALDSIVIDYGS